MSVVGPRPHMIKENERYSKSVNKFMVRHFVKPGITGLAQVKGFRGEIETNEDIINRVKFDLLFRKLVFNLGFKYCIFDCNKFFNRP